MQKNGITLEDYEIDHIFFVSTKETSKCLTLFPSLQVSVSDLNLTFENREMMPFNVFGLGNDTATY